MIKQIQFNQAGAIIRKFIEQANTINESVKLINEKDIEVQLFRDIYCEKPLKVCRQISQNKIEENVCTKQQSTHIFDFNILKSTKMSYEQISNSDLDFQTQLAQYKKRQIVNQNFNENTDKKKYIEKIRSKIVQMSLKHEKNLRNKQQLCEKKMFSNKQLGMAPKKQIQITLRRISNRLTQKQQVTIR